MEGDSGVLDRILFKLFDDENLDVTMSAPWIPLLNLAVM